MSQTDPTRQRNPHLLENMHLDEALRKKPGSASIPLGVNHVAAFKPQSTRQSMQAEWLSLALGAHAARSTRDATTSTPPQYVRQPARPLSVVPKPPERLLYQRLMRRNL